MMSSSWIFSYALTEIRSTASDPQVLHRPWTSKEICDKQLTQNQFLFIGPLLPLRWANMPLMMSKNRANAFYRGANLDEMCSLNQRYTYRNR